MTTLERAEAVERAMSEELDRVVVKSVIYTSGERDPRLPVQRPPDQGKRYMIGQDPRLPRMPDKPTLFDFFKYRFGPAAHLTQSARLARKTGASEKIVLACLLHDIATAGFIRGDHGYWSAQLVEPYVDEEVSWAIRYHQALRFFPDESVGYRYPESYLKLFGPDYTPEPYIERDYRYAREHKWYMSLVDLGAPRDQGSDQGDADAPADVPHEIVQTGGAADLLPAECRRRRHRQGHEEETEGDADWTAISEIIGETLPDLVTKAEAQELGGPDITLLESEQAIFDGGEALALRADPLLDDLTALGQDVGLAFPLVHIDANMGPGWPLPFCGVDLGFCGAGRPGTLSESFPSRRGRLRRK